MSEKTKTNLDVLKKAFAAGLILSIGCIVKLSCDNPIVGNFLFSTGLFAICVFGMNLYTGKIGYIIENKNNPNCLIVWLGNFLGQIVGCTLIRIAKPSIHESASSLMKTKLELPWYSAAITAIFCGILMFAAVDCFKRSQSGILKFAGIVLCVMTFLFAGFEHSIADMGYAVLGISELGEILPYLGFLLIVSIFNGIGGIGIWYLTRNKT